MSPTSSRIWNVGWIDAAQAAFAARDPGRKLQLTAALPEPGSPLDAPPAEHDAPGRPDAPQRVPPADVPRRKLGSIEGRIALLHAVAHIEFNAINLALDAALRFAGLPLDYYRDWLSVARDEARHFEMLQTRLTVLGSHYGALPAHDGLWEMAEKTASDPLLRMALVPRVLEARGLDVTPGMIDRLQSVGDGESADCLRVILEEEVRHVAIGTHWFRQLCAERGLEPDATFLQLLREHLPQRKRASGMNLSARRLAGFSAGELAGV